MRGVSRLSYVAVSCSAKTQPKDMPTHGMQHKTYKADSDHYDDAVWSASNVHTQGTAGTEAAAN